MVLNNLKWAELEDRRTHQRLTLLYKIINNHVEVQTTEVGIQPNSRPSRRHQKQLLRPRAKSDIFSQSFILRTISDWNSLPSSTVNAESATAFKIQLQHPMP